MNNNFFSIYKKFKVFFLNKNKKKIKTFKNIYLIIWDEQKLSIEDDYYDDLSSRKSYKTESSTKELSTKNSGI